MRRLALVCALVMACGNSAHAMNPDASTPGIRNMVAFLGSPGVGRPAGGTTTAVASVVNWSASFQTIYRLNEASGTRVNDGSLGTSLNLTPGGSATSTTNVVEPPRSGGFVAGTNDHFINGTPTGLFYTGSFFAGCFVQRVASGAGDIIGVYQAGSKGWRVSLDASSRPLCTIGTGAAIRSVNVATALPISTFRFVSCTYTTGTGDITADMVGSTTAPVSSGAGAAIVAADAGNALVISRSGGAGTTWQGYIDYCLTTNKALTAAQRCRLASCGVMGELGCECNAADITQYLSTGANASVGGGCTLPPCDAATP